MLRIFSAFILTVALMNLNVKAQESAELPMILPDVVMKQVVSRILKWNFGAASRPKTVLVAERGIKREWLPSIRDVTFQLTAESDIQNSKNGAFLFEEVQRDGSHYTINVGWGDFKCEAYGDVWKFLVGKDEKVRLWRVDGSSWGRGCGGDARRVRGLVLGEIGPNQMRGYEFFGKGRLKSVRLGLSTRDNIRAIFGDECEESCDYDSNWTIQVDYFDDGVEFTKNIGELTDSTTETEYLPRTEFVGKLKAVTISPKKRVSFVKVVFPIAFGRSQSYSIGDSWDETGFAGAVHTSSTIYADGYGLEYCVFGKETFNNLRNKEAKPKELTRGGDLISITYSIPENFESVIFYAREKPRP